MRWSGNAIATQSEDTTDAFGRKKKQQRPLNIGMIKTLVSGGAKVRARARVRVRVRVRASPKVRPYPSSSPLPGIGLGLRSGRARVG